MLSSSSSLSLSTSDDLRRSHHHSHCRVPRMPLSRRCWFVSCLLLLLTVAHWPSMVRADFGDVAADDFTCPAYATCPVICAKDEQSCSSTCATGKFLCANGRCSSDCNAEYALNPKFKINPCANNHCGTTACPKKEGDLAFCPQPPNEEECWDNAEIDKRTPKVLFALWVLWLFALTAAVVAWCAFNQRLRGIEAAPLQDDSVTARRPHDSSEPPTAKQIGYCESIVGTALYGATVTTIWGFQLMFAVLIIYYYAGASPAFAKNFFENVPDERQSLRLFETLWIIGFVWNLMFKWPPSLRSLFWERCRLVDATHVAVWVPTAGPAHHTFDGESAGGSQSAPWVLRLRRWVALVMQSIHTVMSIIFSVEPGLWTYCDVIVHPLNEREKHFVHNFRRYNLHQGVYVPGRWHNPPTIKEWVALRPGLSTEQVTERRRHVGPNIIPMKPPTPAGVLWKEFTHIYYTYQNFIMWSWMPLNYWYMAMVQTSVIITGGVTLAMFAYRNETNLYQLTHMEGDAQVLRDGTITPTPHHELVPGDVVLVEPGRTYCDMVLVESAGVLVDESALTGESNPIAKTALDPAEGKAAYSELTHKRHTIQAGTTVLESETGHNFAIITKTGSFTTKGELLREIFAYQRHQFKFDTEVTLVIAVLFIYAIFCFFVTITFLNHSPVYAIFYGMYCVASVLPPLLPTVFTVSVGVSDNRLAAKRIACTNSEEILVAGKVKRAFFDKTGTLTKQGLDFISSRDRESWASNASTPSATMSMAMATCHALTESTITGELVGNPVDRTMFAASGARLGGMSGSSLMVTDGTGKTVAVVKHFDFDHHRMTQSVIVKYDGQLVAFVKGSGESISQLCRAESLPNDFYPQLTASAKAGVYQISMARKRLDKDVESRLAELGRDEVEHDLDFIGVVNFKNVLREETPGVIAELEQGEVRCIMVTGDSVLTGIRIAKESGIIPQGRKVILGNEVTSDGNIVWLDESDAQVALPPLEALDAKGIDLAMTGHVWDTLRRDDPKFANAVADYVRVFGRCTPFDKVSVVTSFVDRGFISLMTGDGGNDCGALKTAHVGVALSDSEASIVAPFSSLDKCITSVVEVLREGRCALASALASYKFMIMYGQIMTFNQMINAYFATTFSEWCWVFMDGVWTISLGFTLPLSRAAERLAPTRPTSSLLGLHTMASALGVLCIHYLFTVIALMVLFHQDWFQCRKWRGQDVSNVLVIGDNYETETLFLISGFQYITSAVTYNFGYEWRRGFFNNTPLVGMLAFFTVLHFYVTLVPGRLSCIFRVNCDNEHVVRSVTAFDEFAIQNDQHTTLMPVGFRFALLIIMILNAACVIAWDVYVVNRTRQRVSAQRRDQRKVKLVTSNTEADEGGGPV